MKTIIVLLAAIILAASCKNWNGDLREEIKRQVDEAKEVQWANIGGPR